MSFDSLSPSSLSFDKSWVSTALMTRKICYFSELRLCDGWVLWCERRPEEQGRSVIVGYSPQGKFIDLSPKEFSVGSDVNEYGGGAWCASSFERHGEKLIEIIFHDAKKGGIWRSIMGETPESLLSRDWEGKEYSYADFARHEEKIFCVRECHDDIAFMDIIMVDLQKNIHILAEGADFYASPRPSSDGKFIAWVEWHHPNMPWTSTQLYVAPLFDKEQRICLEGSEENISVMEPLWCGEWLYALSDRPSLFHSQKERHWTPIAFSYEKKEGWRRISTKVAPFEIGFPQWVFGQCSYNVFLNGDILACGHKEGKLILLAYRRNGENDNEREWEEVPFQGEIENIPQILTQGKRLEDSCYCWINQGEKTPPFIAKAFFREKVISLKTAWSLPLMVKDEDISQAKFISCLARDNISLLHALFYAPAKGVHTCSFIAEGEKPPLMVLVHGGPTAQAQRALSFKVQWWTSRGFAVLDVNYRGSTGFGRAYRDALNGQWGIMDVADCCDVVRYVQKLGWVDKKRTVIRGSSAGGLTVLSALAHSELFVAGTSLYGVTDLTALVRDTHRFEAHYLEGLVAPYPEGEAIYKERSPLSWFEKIKQPVFFFHGAKDRVVPLDHAKALYNYLPNASYHIYPDEGHGFRSPEVLADMFQRELEFYLNIFAL